MYDITKEFKLFVDIAKNLKSDKIYIVNDRVYSIIQNTIIKSSINSLSQYLNDILEIDMVNILLIFEENKHTGNPIYLYGNNIQCGDILITFVKIYGESPNIKLNYVLNNNPIYSNDNLRDDEYFNTILSYKVIDGASLFIIDNKYPMTIYGSLLNVNKSDTVKLDIYPIDDISFLSVFRVNKKKFIIETYIRFLYLK